MAPRIVRSVVETTKSRLGYAGWGFADQAMSSLSNFGVGLVAARASTSEQFGAFSVAFATSVIGVGIARALVSEVYSVRYSGGGQTISAASGLDPDSGPAPDALGELLEVESELQELDAGPTAPSPRRMVGEKPPVSATIPRSRARWVCRSCSGFSPASPAPSPASSRPDHSVLRC